MCPPNFRCGAARALARSWPMHGRIPRRKQGRPGGRACGWLHYSYSLRLRRIGRGPTRGSRCVRRWVYPGPGSCSKAILVRVGDSGAHTDGPRAEASRSGSSRQPSRHRASCDPSRMVVPCGSLPQLRIGDLWAVELPSKTTKNCIPSPETLLSYSSCFGHLHKLLPQTM